MNIEMPIQIIWGMVGYVLVSTGWFIWWAATTTQQLKTLEKLVNDLAGMNNSFAKKEDIAREMGVIEKNQETMWLKFEKLKEKVDGQK